MLRDKIVELSRELADLSRRSKSCSGALPASPGDLTDVHSPDYVISATADVATFEYGEVLSRQRAPCTGASDLGILAGTQRERIFPGLQGANMTENTGSQPWDVPLV